MTYTTASGEVIPQGPDAFNPPAQFKTWADHQAMWNSRVIVPLDANRTALASPELRDGVRCLVTGTGIEWLRVGGVWKPWDSVWITDTPVLTSVTVGNGASTGRHQFRAGQCFVEGRLLLGSTTTFSGQPKVNHVYGTADAGSFAATAWPLGKLFALDAGVALYYGEVVGETATQASLYAADTSSTYARGAQVSLTVPFTIGNADSLLWKYDYTPA